MKERWFVLDINPEPWAIGDVGVRRNGGKLKGFVGRNQQLWNYQQAVKEAVGTGHELIRGKVKLTCIFWRRRDEYRNHQARTHRTGEADATNMLKATEDALQGVLYVNDKDNNEVHSYIIDQDTDTRPRIIICVAPNSDPPDIINQLPDDVLQQMKDLEEPPAALPEDDPWADGDIPF